jgi:hypothetical protein
MDSKLKRVTAKRQSMAAIKKWSQTWPMQFPLKPSMGTDWHGFQVQYPDRTHARFGADAPDIRAA